MYTAGATFTSPSVGALVEEIAVIGNSMKNRVNTRGNGCIKGRCGFTRFSIIGNNLDVLDNAVVLQTTLKHRVSVSTLSQVPLLLHGLILDG